MRYIQVPLESQPILQILLISDILLIITFVGGYVRFRRNWASRVGSLPEAFLLLESTLWRRYPELPDGLTLREALSRIEELGIEVDWQEMYSLLKQYESYKYGDIKLNNSPLAEIIKLIAIIKGDERFPRRYSITDQK